MIGASQQALLLRRQRLVARSEVLRGRLVLETTHWRGPLAAADRVLLIGRWLHAQRRWLIGTAALLLVVRPRRAFRWLGRGWWVWRVSRRLRPWLTVASSLWQQRGERGRGSSAGRSAGPA